MTDDGAAAGVPVAPAQLAIPHSSGCQEGEEREGEEGRRRRKRRKTEGGFKDGEKNKRPCVFPCHRD